MMICDKCFSLSACNCPDKVPFEVDDSIAEIISILNKKKYTTVYCCGGHVDRERLLHKEYPEIYIKFTPQAFINLMLIPEFMEADFSTSIIRCRVCPENFIIYKPNIPKRYQRFTVNEDIIRACEQQLEKYRAELLQWVNQLIPLDASALDI